MKLNLRHPALTAVLIATAACTPEGSVLDPDERPDPLPAAALSADFSFFSERAPEEGAAATSWAEALETVALAEDQMSVLRVPQALIMEATASQGTRDELAWRWPFSTTVDGAPYDGELRAVVSANQHEWDLFVTAPDHSPALSDYLWGKAYTPSNGYDGQLWIADAAAGNADVVALVSWIHTADNDLDVAFSASEASSWTIQRSAGENALTYLVVGVPQARVVWDDATGSGSAWSSSTGEMCWDENLVDVAC